MVDINLTGVFNTVRAALPSMVERGEGGSLVLTSSTAGLRAYQNTAHYTAAKHGVIGLMKVLAQECGPHGIRVNAVCPTTVRTPLVINDSTFELFAPDVENPGEDDVREAFAGLNILPDVPWIEPGDVLATRCSSSARMRPSTSPASRSRSTPATRSRPDVPPLDSRAPARHYYYRIDFRSDEERTFNAVPRISRASTSTAAGSSPTRRSASTSSRRRPARRSASSPRPTTPTSIAPSRPPARRSTRRTGRRGPSPSARR